MHLPVFGGGTGIQIPTIGDPDQLEVAGRGT
jgi:hypothetical protein